jgi:hypothetical protein
MLGKWPKDEVLTIMTSNRNPNFFRYRRAEEGPDSLLAPALRHIIQQAWLLRWLGSVK